MTPGQRFERAYPLDDRNAPRRARAAVAELTGSDERLRRDLTIVVSELVANAVRHAPRVDGGEVVLAITREADVMRVEVTDPGDGFDPSPAAARGRPRPRHRQPHRTQVGRRACGLHGRLVRAPDPVLSGSRRGRRTGRSEPDAGYNRLWARSSARDRGYW